MVLYMSLMTLFNSLALSAYSALFYKKRDYRLLGFATFFFTCWVTSAVNLAIWVVR